MKLIHATTEIPAGRRGACLAIGVFDGVHLGHQQIIRQTVSDARQHDALAVIVTFDKHPNTVVAPDRVPPQIFSRAQKLRAAEGLGADVLLEIPFDKALSERSGADFIRGLWAGFGKIHSICVGADFVFGFKRSGNVALLRAIGAELQFHVHGMAAVALDGATVSSTRIREEIRRGDLDAAGQMLGRPYAICGRVLEGDKIGRRLEFPTANLDIAGLVLPPNGVYAACVLHNDKLHPAALNIGHRPTVPGARPELRAEAHLLDFSGNLYGLELEVQPTVKLRDEQRFDSMEDLKRQISLDVARVRSLA